MRGETLYLDMGWLKEDAVLYVVLWGRGVVWHGSQCDVWLGSRQKKVHEHG